jgi:hypothetical protein
MRQTLDCLAVLQCEISTKTIVPAWMLANWKELLRDCTELQVVRLAVNTLKWHIDVGAVMLVKGHRSVHALT